MVFSLWVDSGGIKLMSLGYILIYTTKHHQFFQLTTQKLWTKEHKLMEIQGECPLHLVETEDSCRMLFIFLFQVRETNTPLQIQTTIYSLAQKKQAQNGHTCPSRDQLSSFISTLKTFECVLPAVLWHVLIACILPHCVFLIEPEPHLPSFLQIQTSPVIIRTVAWEGNSQSGSGHPWW